MKHSVDVTLIALYGRKGVGKTTLGVSLSILYARHFKAPIYSNIALTIPTIPSIETVRIRKTVDLIQMCKDEPCSCSPRVYLVDEFEKSFTSQIGWVSKEREQSLTELVSNIRKHNVIAFIATSQLKRKIKNTFRHNCDYIIEPTGTLDLADCPEYYIWNDVELYEEGARSRYNHAELCSAILPIQFLEQTFNTREIVPLAWE